MVLFITGCGTDPADEGKKNIDTETGEVLKKEVFVNFADSLNKIDIGEKRSFFFSANRDIASIAVLAMFHEIDGKIETNRKSITGDIVEKYIESIYKTDLKDRNNVFFVFDGSKISVAFLLIMK